MKSRPYRHSDLPAMQQFMAETWAATDGLGCLHPGDIPHHLYSGNKLFDPRSPSVAVLMSCWTQATTREPSC